MVKSGNGANLGFETQLWAAADKMRGHMDAAEYKHIVLGLIFLKYISDSFQVRYDDLVAKQKKEFTDPEDRDEYAAANIFWVAVQSRWKNIQNNAKQATIGQTVDDAMTAIEQENPTLKGVLPKDYSASRERIMCGAERKTPACLPKPRRRQVNTRMFPASASPRQLTRSRPAATCSRPAATLALRKLRTTAYPLKRRWRN